MRKVVVDVDFYVFSSTKTSSLKLSKKRAIYLRNDISIFAVQNEVVL